MTSLKKIVILFGVCAFAISVQARIMKFWTYQELFDQSDIVAIAKPISTEDTAERASFANFSPEIHVVGVSTEFSVSVVMKGDKSVNKFTLHHYRRSDQLPPNNVEMDAPELVAFDPKGEVRYLLFLRRGTNENYSPTSGQIDPALFSVIRLRGGAQ